MEESKKRILIIISTFVVGIVLIYIIALNFFEREPPQEIALEYEETVGDIEGGEKINYLAIDFELSDVQGEKVKLSDYANKIIILLFWNIWNSNAQDQFVILDSYYQEIKNNQDIVLVAVNNQEDKSIISNFIRRGEYALPVLIDEDGKIGETYGISVLPATYFIDKQGYVKHVFIGLMNKDAIKSEIENLQI